MTYRVDFTPAARRQFLSLPTPLAIFVKISSAAAKVLWCTSGDSCKSAEKARFVPQRKYARTGFPSRSPSLACVIAAKDP